VRDIIPMSAGATCVVQRLADRTREPIAVVADRGGPAPRMHSPAENFAERRCVARRRRGGGLEDQCAGAFAEQAAVVARVERAQHLCREQSEAVVVEQHLRLDRRFVPHGDRAVGLAVGAAPRMPR
jgi:hypothetical protein